MTSRSLLDFVASRLIRRYFHRRTTSVSRSFELEQRWSNGVIPECSRNFVFENPGEFDELIPEAAEVEEIQALGTRCQINRCKRRLVTNRNCRRTDAGHSRTPFDHTLARLLLKYFESDGNEPEIMQLSLFHHSGHSARIVRTSFHVASPPPPLPPPIHLVDVGRIDNKKPRWNSVAASIARNSTKLFFGSLQSGASSARSPMENTDGKYRNRYLEFSLNRLTSIHPLHPFCVVHLCTYANQQRSASSIVEQARTIANRSKCAFPGRLISCTFVRTFCIFYIRIRRGDLVLELF